MQILYKTFIAASLIAGCGLTASAQSLGGVFPPTVNEGHKSAQFRTGYNEDNERWAHRLHYQQSINDDLMWRAIVQVRETADSDTDFDNVGGELFWQLTENNSGWQSGVRFDVRLRDEERPNTFGFNWMNQWQVDPDWHVRTVLLTAADFGENTRDGIFVQTRGQLHRKLKAGHGVGVELYSVYGSTDSFRDFDAQSHEIGPYYSLPVAKDWSLWGSALFGLTDGTPDSNLKLWITRRF